MRQSVRTFDRVDAGVIGVVAALLAVCVWADAYLGPLFNSSALIFNPSPVYPTLLLFCLLRRNRVVSLVCLVLALIATFAGLLLEEADIRSVLHRSLAAVAILATGYLVDAFIRSRRIIDSAGAQLLDRAHELEATNAELSAREEEIARQNEELQSQTEELERQSEELRLANDELVRREKMLEALLSLSRNLAASTSSSETMDKICHALGELINGQNHATATAIVQRHGDEVRVLCHHGFAGGIERESWPYKDSFASLVIERGRTGYLEDVSLRPELVIPSAKSGPPMRSVLAAPLRIAGQALGALEVYHSDKHTWTDEQIGLIESLAAQTSISLESSELFERVNDERRRMKTVLQTVPFGIAITDPACKTIIVNPAGSAMINVPAETELDFPSLEARWKVQQGGKPVPFEQRPVVRAARNGEIVAGEEYEFVVSGGRRLSVLVSAAPIYGRNTEIVGAVVGWADVTQLKQLQTELDARRREAEESSLRKSRFLAAVSHDIRTPANAISLLAELMQRAATSPAMNGEIPEIATDLKRSAITLVDLVSDVLDITRFDSGKVDLQETIVPLAELISEECRGLQQSAREKGLGFDCLLPPPSVTVRTDRVKLSRILTNLIGNAIKFTERGRITVAAQDNDGDGSIAISVSDTGCGIPAEHHERIFDEYFQLKNAERDRSRGSGLGLAITKRLLDAMGGEVRVKSEVGKGSTFTVILPNKSVVAV